MIEPPPIHSTSRPQGSFIRWIDSVKYRLPSCVTFTPFTSCAGQPGRLMFSTMSRGNVSRSVICLTSESTIPW